MGAPMARGTVTRVMVINPKKPNSANRHCCRVQLVNGNEVTAYVTGRGMGSINVHSNVLLIGGRVPDLPGVRYKVVRGALDAHGVDGEVPLTHGGDPVQRKNSRSKYGVKKKK